MEVSLYTTKWKDDWMVQEVNKSISLIEQSEKYGAKNYNPLPIVISEAEGVWISDPEGNKYMD
ncbi:ornithine--oxo-acid transaminase, partial [Niallia nealsonii AAU1]